MHCLSYLLAPTSRLRRLAPLLLLAASPLASAQAAAQPMSAQAASDAAQLDLTLPKDAALATTQTAYQADPPGTFYGDTTGRKRTRVVNRVACPQPVNPDNDSGLSGALTTGIGYSEGYGSSHYNAADLNYCKTFVSDEGKPRTMNFNLHVEQADGPFLRGPYDDYGPYTAPRGRMPMW